MYIVAGREHLRQDRTWYRVFNKENLEYHVVYSTDTRIFIGSANPDPFKNYWEDFIKIDAIATITTHEVKTLDEAANYIRMEELLR